jgi:hypothetical protein
VGSAAPLALLKNLCLWRDPPRLLANGIVVGSNDDSNVAGTGGLRCSNDMRQ